MTGNLIEWVKAFFLGVVEGLTEWLPVSSTGHMLLLDALLSLKASDAFKEMFFVVIQLGAIAAVVVLYGGRLAPLGRKKTAEQKRAVLTLWKKIALACIPIATLGLFLDELAEHYLGTPFSIACALIVYGAAFIAIEDKNGGIRARVSTLVDLSCVDALIIGLFQVLSIVPGTSRSGATLLGALLIGVARPVAAEFTFFLAIPTMLGASAVKLLQFGLRFSPWEAVLLVTGAVVAFVVSMLSIRFLMEYIRRHSFAAFGWYRIALGALVLLLVALR